MEEQSSRQLIPVLLSPQLPLDFLLHVAPESQFDSISGRSLVDPSTFSANLSSLRVAKKNLSANLSTAHPRGFAELIAEKMRATGPAASRLEP